MENEFFHLMRFAIEKLVYICFIFLKGYLTYQINAKIEIVVEVVGDMIGLLTEMNFHLIFRLVVCSIGTANFGEYILTKIAKFNDFGKVFFFSLIVNLLQF